MRNLLAGYALGIDLALVIWGLTICPGQLRSFSSAVKAFFLIGWAACLIILPMLVFFVTDTFGKQN